MNLIISTCGTSTLTNLADENTRKLVTIHANAKQLSDIKSEDDLDKLKVLINTAGTKLGSADVRDTKRASAELNGILSFHGDRLPLDSRDIYILLHTDTWLGTSAAELLQSKLESYHINPQLQRIKSLNTISRTAFDNGLCNLITWAYQTIPGYRSIKYRTIFNLAGGFKSVQGFMQTLGMFYADEIIYIFETGSELLRIPRLPIDLDAAAQKIMTTNAIAFRRLDILGPQINKTIPKDIPETLLYTLEDATELSPWGKLLWSAFKDSLYKEKLLDSPTQQIRFNNLFRKDTEGLSPDRLFILNQRIDDMTRFMDSTDHPNPPRLDIKPLRNNPKPPSTHEADAWADADCRRIYFHYESNIAVLDQLGKPLH